MKISVVGLGKLGAPLAAVLAFEGHTVVGVDRDSRPVQLINQGVAPVNEPGLDDLIAHCGGRLTATSDTGAAVRGTELTFVVVPTPSDETGAFSLRFVVDAIDSIGDGVAKKAEFHVIVVTSTVMPGSMDTHIRPRLETAAGKRCGDGIGLCYGPEFIALGSVITDLRNPDFVLIGESDERSGEALRMVYERLCRNSPPIVRMDFLNAELAKLAVNTFVTTKISYANTLAELCERLPGANVDIVTSALGLDTRIGRKYLRGGLGYGGPCFPRDNLAFAALARLVGADATLPEATDRVNRRQVPRLSEIVVAHMREGGTVGILGLSYKPGTDVVDEAQGLELAQQLLNSGVSVAVFDPAAMANAGRYLNGPVVFASSLEECVRHADVVVVATPWEDFGRLNSGMLDPRKESVAVIDCWRMLQRERLGPRARYLALGISDMEHASL